MKYKIVECFVGNKEQYYKIYYKNFLSFRWKLWRPKMFTETIFKTTHNLQYSDYVKVENDSPHFNTIENAETSIKLYKREKYKGYNIRPLIKCDLCNNMHVVYAIDRYDDKYYFMKKIYNTIDEVKAYIDDNLIITSTVIKKLKL